jgi:acetylornithine deacetylase
VSRLPPPRELLAELVALPSASSFDPALEQGNRAVIDRLAGWAAALGAAVRIDPLPGPVPRANLVASFGDGDGGLVLAGHTDTVAAEPDSWTRDPLRLVEEHGRLYGLGACDMKGFFAAALHAAARSDPARRRAPLHLVATADEECAMAGIRALAAAGLPRARWAVVGEPTGLVPVRAHKGVLMERLVLHGRAAHSSDPAQGASAVEGMAKVLDALLAWRDELQRHHRDPAFAVPVPTLNPGVLRGGDRPNRVCARCELQLDLRSLPGMDQEALRVELCARVARALDGSGLRFELRSLYPGTAALSTPPESALVRAAEALVGQPATTAPYGTEAPWFAAAGLETLVLGPGHIAQAHQPDEFLAAEALEPAVELFAALIERCGATGTDDAPATRGS